MRWIFTVCAAVYAVQLVAHSFGSNLMEDVFGLRAWTLSGTAQAPSLSFNFLFPLQLLTYMVLHSPTDIWHIFWNLLLLWFFGRELEAVMGKAAFLKLLLVGGVVGGVMQWAYGLYTDSTIPTIGASGSCVHGDGALLLQVASTNHLAHHSTYSGARAPAGCLLRSQ